VSTAVVVARGYGIEKKNEVIADNQEKKEDDTVSNEHIE